MVHWQTMYKQMEAEVTHVGARVDDHGEGQCAWMHTHTRLKVPRPKRSVGRGLGRMILGQM